MNEISFPVLIILIIVFFALFIVSYLSIRMLMPIFDYIVFGLMNLYNNISLKFIKRK